MFHEATPAEELAVGLATLETELGERQGQLQQLVRWAGPGGHQGAGAARLAHAEAGCRVAPCKSAGPAARRLAAPGTLYNRAR